MAAAKRRDRDLKARRESAKNSSLVHFECTGKYFYLTDVIIMNGDSFDELEDMDQIKDPKLILPDGITSESVLEDLFGVVGEPGPICPNSNSQAEVTNYFPGQHTYPTHDSHHNLVTMAPPAPRQMPRTTMLPSQVPFLHNNGTAVPFPTTSSTIRGFTMPTNVGTSSWIPATVSPMQLQRDDTYNSRSMAPATQRLDATQLHQNFTHDSSADGNMWDLEMAGAPVSEEALHAAEFSLEDDNEWRKYVRGLDDGTLFGKKT
jgi:hypothetical protein